MNKYVFTYCENKFPQYVKSGDAISYIMPVAKYFCRGKGLDIGGTKNWHFPGARIINIENEDQYDAYCLPNGKFDYIISSHCLEHLKDPEAALLYWKSHLKVGGVLFLYLPHPDMTYWLMDCEKHKQKLFPQLVEQWLKRLNFNDILISGRDMYYSFTAIGFKK